MKSLRPDRFVIREHQPEEHVVPTTSGWHCPVCSTAVPHPHRPGRARVYCTNSCKQRAYRWRRRRRHLLAVEPPPERARSRDCVHALRSDDDIVTKPHRLNPLSADPRRVTACGTFAHAARDHATRFGHTKFFAIADDADPQRATPGRCRSCIELLDVPIESISTIFQRLGIETSRRAA